MADAPRHGAGPAKGHRPGERVRFPPRQPHDPRQRARESWRNWTQADVDQELGRWFPIVLPPASADATRVLQPDEVVTVPIVLPPDLAALLPSKLRRRGLAKGRRRRRT